MFGFQSKLLPFSIAQFSSSIEKTLKCNLLKKRTNEELTYETNIYLFFKWIRHWFETID